MPTYLRLRCETIGETQYWNHFSSPPPNHNREIWGFFPQIGNDDDGYGFVEVVYFNPLTGRYEDRYGECLPVQPLLWENINEPLVPMTHPTRDGAMEAALAKITAST